jgi:hypothetical protein
MKRYALIYARADQVATYLPGNYTVAGETIEQETSWSPVHPGGQKIESSRWATVIEGRDNAGWTLDDYVLPRLASGLYFGKEIDLSHPVMNSIA